MDTTRTANRPRKTGKLPGSDTPVPYSAEAERAVLGACLLDKFAYLQAAPLLRGEFFFNSAHRKIWDAYLALDAESRAFDMVTVVEQLQQSNTLDAVGGVGYVSSLTDGLPHRPNIEHYVEIVREKSQLRNLYMTATAAANAALAQEQPAAEIIAESTNRLLDIMAATRKIEVYHAADVVPEMFAEMRKVGKQPKSGVMGRPFGIPELDEMTGGMMVGENIVIAGYSSDGKSLTAGQILYENCSGENCDPIPALSFTQEMTRQQYLRRMIPQATGGFFPGSRLRDYRGLEASDFAFLEVAEKKLAKMPLWIVDASSVSTREMLAIARAHVRKHNIKLFVMDYVQLIRPDGEDSDYQRVTNAGEGIRQLAKDEGINTIIVSQLTWTKEKKKTPPNMGQLRSSGDLANGAHIILFPFRPENAQGYLTGEDQIRIGKMREGGRKPIPVELDTSLLKYVPRSVVKEEKPAKKTAPEKAVEAKVKKAAASSGPEQKSF